MKKLKKGFTLVELVIVIAVIAVLAAVLIPTFSGIVQKSKVTADIQTCEAINSVIATAESMDEVVAEMEANDISVTKLSATAANHKFFWDETSKQMVLMNGKFEVVNETTTFDATTAKLWQPVKKGSEVALTDKFVFNYYLTQDTNTNFNITTLSHLDTGSHKITGDVSIESTVSGGEAHLTGMFADVTINTPNSDVIQNGTIENLNVVAVANNSLEINGYVGALAITAGKVDVKDTAYVKELTVKATEAKVVNAGVIEKLAKDANATITTEGTNANFTNNGGTVVDVAQSGVNESAVQTGNFALTIEDVAGLENFRDAVNGGATFKDITVNLAANQTFTLAAGWTPIGEFAREIPEGGNPYLGFQGTFDGNGSTIVNLNNDGYVPSEQALSRNTNTIKDRYEFNYGFFGYVSNATIRNLNFSNVTINIPVGATYYGDSVAAVVGYSYGNLTIGNVDVATESSVTSAITAYDGVAGILGRAYGDGTHQIYITECSNKATITAGEKAANFVGIASKGGSLFIQNSSANATVTVNAEGLAYDIKKKKYRKAGYVAGAVGLSGKTAVTITSTSIEGAINITYAHGTQESDWTLQKHAYVNGVEPSISTGTSCSATISEPTERA